MSIWRYKVIFFSGCLCLVFQYAICLYKSVQDLIFTLHGDYCEVILEKRQVSLMGLRIQYVNGSVNISATVNWQANFRLKGPLIHLCSVIISLGFCLHYIACCLA